MKRYHFDNTIEEPLYDNDEKILKSIEHTGLESAVKTCGSHRICHGHAI